MMFFEFGCTGRLVMSSFQALSAGNTCMAARILSASGVLNITGSLIGGSAGSGRPLECLTPSCGADAATRAKNSNNDKATARGFMANSPNAGATTSIYPRRIVRDGMTVVKEKNRCQSLSRLNAQV